MPTAPNNQKIKQWGQQLGFDLVGIASAQPVEHSQTFLDYLAKEYHGNMMYLARNIEKRLDVKKLMPGANSVICVAISYYHNEGVPDLQGADCVVARYARGKDYHIVIKEKLHKLVEVLKDNFGQNNQFRCFVDTAPIMEKYFAAQAGLGWIGKNGLLINPEYGSWLLLGEIVTNLELEPDTILPEQCGQCTKCLDACPTKALIAERVLKAKNCLSYLTVENKNEIPKEFHESLSKRVFGCDTCQDVCPFNQNIKEGHEKSFYKKIDISLEKIEKMTDQKFQQTFADSVISRTSREHLLSILKIIKAQTKEPLREK